MTERKSAARGARGARTPDKRLLALAMAAFALGFAEFSMMGILPDVAAGTGVDIPTAGNYVSAYAIGVCFGALILVFGHNIAPKRLLVAFAVLMVIGNGLAAAAPSAHTLLAARFVAGLPHGAYFGTATLVAKKLAAPGKEAAAVSTMVLGQTLANMVGVPFGTLLSAAISWRAAYAFVAVWAAVAAILLARFIPNLAYSRHASLTGQFGFLRKPAPWIVLGAVFAGNTGLFCWWSYVSPWLETQGGFNALTLPLLLVLAGAGMVAGSTLGGRAADALSPGREAALGQGLSAACLLAIFFVSGHTASVFLLVATSFAMFSMSSAQQLIMVKVGSGGGEMIGSALVQIAYNGANALGAIIGQQVLNAGFSYNVSSVAGAPFALASMALLAVFALRFERHAVDQLPNACSPVRQA